MGVVQSTRSSRVRPVSGSRRCRLAIFVLMLLVVPLATAAEAFAQDGPRMYRRWAVAGLGATLAMIPALLIDEPNGDRRCTSRACLVPATAAAGGVLGFMIGLERDRAAARRYVAGPSLRIERRTFRLEQLLPETMALFDGGAVIVGNEGVLALEGEGPLIPRGGQIRGISGATAMPAHNAILAATGSGVFAFPLRGMDGDGNLVLREGGNAMEPVAANEIVVGGRDLLRRLRLTGQGAVVTLTEEMRVMSPGHFSGLAYSPYSGIVWTLSGDRVVARTVGQLEEVGSVQLPATGRALTLSGDRMLVAAGNAGIFILDVGRPESPRLIGQITGIQFAFHAALDGDRAYVAAGRLGLLVIDISDPAAPQTIGVARNLGLVSHVELGADGKLYVLDRGDRRLFVVELQTAGGV